MMEADTWRGRDAFVPVPARAAWPLPFGEPFHTSLSGQATREWPGSSGVLFPTAFEITLSSREDLWAELPGLLTGAK